MSGAVARLFEGDSVAVHLGRKLTGGQLLARLRQNQIRVGVSFDIEIGEQRRLRVAGGVYGVHVVHVVHAVDLLLDGRGHGLLQGLGIGADVGGLQLISGGTMFGNCATGKVAIVTAPTITVRIAITIATIGRLMKNLDMIFDSFQP